MRAHRSEPEPTPEQSPWQRLDAAFRKVLTVSKEDLLKEEAKLKAAKEKKREPRKPH